MTEEELLEIFERLEAKILARRNLINQPALDALVESIQELTEEVRASNES